MPVNTLKELLRLRLGETYNGEQEMLQLLDAIETETQSRLLRDRLRGHRDEAGRHLTLLEKSFELLGTDPPKASCPALHGLCEERRGFMREVPGPVSLETYHVDVLNRASQYKSAAYQGLVELARDIGQNDVRSLLERCLQDEVAAAGWIREKRSSVVNEVRAAGIDRSIEARPA